MKFYRLFLLVVSSMINDSVIPYLILKYNQGLWMNIAKDQLFCLLGPNGAGKTTTINCLTGLFPVTGGDGKLNLALFLVFVS